MSDTISRQAAIEAIKEIRDKIWDVDIPSPTVPEYIEHHQQMAHLMNECDNKLHELYLLPSAQPEQRWIPFTTRPLTEEEKEEHSEWDGILDCKLPDDGQRILVSISVRGHECVQYDEFYMDDGCYLDSGYEIGTEAVAWKPLPEPYRKEGEPEP